MADELVSDVRELSDNTHLSTSVSGSMSLVLTNSHTAAVQ